MIRAPKYKPYPEYMSSGVEWLGDVPGHWTVSRLGKYFDERREKVSDKEYEPLSVTMQGIVPRLDTAAKTDAGDNRKRVCVGDFVINSRSDRKGSSGVSPLNGSVSLISIVLTPRQMEGTFLHHLLRSQPFQEEFYRYGKGIVADLWSTNYSEMKNILLPIPSLPEQRAIATFLDQETGKIDQLVSKQERMIELLKEKRQAVISHAVTKGLDPNAPMKDSGIEWLGEIPEHWDICLVKHKLELITDGSHISPETEGGKHYFVSIKDIEGDQINFDDALLTTDESYRYLVHTGCKPQGGDVLFSKDGTIGKTTVVRESDDFVIASSLIVLRPNQKRLDSRFLHHVCQGFVIQGQVNSFVKGAALMRLSLLNLNKVWATFPPKSEQQAVVKYLDLETEKIDHLIAKAEQAIELMKERRTALISAAVTGKIDVREAVTYETKQPLLMVAEELTEYRVKEREARG